MGYKQSKNICKLFSLHLIISPLSVSATDDQQNSTPWIGILIITLSILFLIITTAVAAYIRRYGRGIFGAAADHREAPVPSRLHTASIESLPSLRYSEIKMQREMEVTCAVCLEEFQDSEVLRLLPDCSHVFHPGCIDPWLASHVTCPVCRVSLEHREGLGVGVSTVLQRLSSGISLPEGFDLPEVFDDQDQHFDDHHRTA